MIRDRTIRTRVKLVGKLPTTGEVLRGSLLERTAVTPKTARNAHAAKATGCSQPLTHPTKQTLAPSGAGVFLFEGVPACSLTHFGR
jgi:hypothetical protein